jgi:retron-type reverse transcriptase
VEDETTQRCIRKLKGKRAPGLDNISPHLIKIAENELTVPLTDLFNFWIWTNSIPTDLNRSCIVPVLKKGDQTNPNNYRPISLLTAIAKLFEMVIEVQIEDHFNQMFSKDMFGYRRKLSCEHAIVELTEKCRRDLDHKLHSVVAALDLSRAFDVVNHELPLKKLEPMALIKGP